MDAAAVGTIGGTYIGNPLCCVAALATIKFMEDEKLHERAIRIGEILALRFLKLLREYPEIGDVRGVGAMQGIEFVHNSDPRKPNGELCHAVIAGCAERGLILLSAGTFKNIIRVLAPLVITDEQLNQGLDILESEIQNATKK